MYQTLQTLSAPAARTLISLIFVTSGLSKISAYADTQAWMDAMGVPGALLPLVIALEVIAGISVILGWKARIAAFLLAGFSIVSALLFHNNFADQAEMTNFMKNLAIAGGFLSIVAHGAGAYSLDNRNVNA